MDESSIYAIIYSFFFLVILFSIVLRRFSPIVMSKQQESDKTNSPSACDFFEMPPSQPRDSFEEKMAPCQRCGVSFESHPPFPPRPFSSPNDSFEDRPRPTSDDERDEREIQAENERRRREKEGKWKSDVIWLWFITKCIRFCVACHCACWKVDENLLWVVRILSN